MSQNTDSPQGTNALSRRSFIAGTAALIAMGAVGAVTLSGCSTSTSNDSTNTTGAALSGSITAVGSTALQPLVEAAAEQFMAENSGVTITVQGGGSGTGLTQISQGTVQIGNSDVSAEDKNIDASNLTDNKVCVVGMGPIANSACGVTNITTGQLISIFAGTVTNWKTLGGADQAIVVINRTSGSGTRATFEKYGLGGSTPITAQEQDSSGTVLTMVAQTPGAISYLAFSYYDKTVTGLSLGGVAPEAANVEDGSWPIWSYEHMYTSSTPDTTTQAFIDYVQSDAVQGSLVESLGYIPSSDMKVTSHA